MLQAFQELLYTLPLAAVWPHVAAVERVTLRNFT